MIKEKLITSLHNSHPNGQLNRNLTLIFMIQCKCYKKSPTVKMNLLSLHFGQIYSLYILHWTQSPYFSLCSIQGILQILQVEPWFSSSSLLLLSFDDSAKLLHWCDGPGCCSSWGFPSLIAAPDSIFFFLLSRAPTFSALFYCNKVINVFFTETFALSTKIVLGSFLKMFSRVNG